MNFLVTKCDQIVSQFGTVTLYSNTVVYFQTFLQ
jgi:hypothetical protein